MQSYDKSNIRIISKDRQFITKNYDDSYIRGTYEIYNNNEFIVSFTYEVHNSTITPRSVERVYNIYSSICLEQLLLFLKGVDIDDPIVKGFHRHITYSKDLMIGYIA